MTNSKRGGIAFTACGEKRELRFTINAQVRYQDATGETLIEGIQAFQEKPTDMKRLRRLFYFGVDHDDTMTEDVVGDMIDDLGLEKAGELIGKAVKAAFPVPEKPADEVADVASVEGNGAKPKSVKATATA